MRFDFRSKGLISVLRMASINTASAEVGRGQVVTLDSEFEDMRFLMSE